MSEWKTVALENLMPHRTESVDPRKSPHERFELHSIPAHDRGEPETLFGAEIGSSKQRIRPSDVLLAKIVPHIRRSHVVGAANAYQQIASSEWIVFRGEDVLPDYLRHLLLGNDFHARFMETVAGVGGSLMRARPQYVKKIRVPLPPLAEQRRIASILDEADAIRTKRRAQLTHLDELPQSLFHEMFGGVHDRELLGNSIQETRYGTSSKADDSGTPALRIPNIVGGCLDMSNMKSVPITEKEFKRLKLCEGDLLFVRSNGNPENVGRCATYDSSAVAAAGLDPEHIIYASYLIRVRLSRGVPEFVSSFMASNEGRQQLRERSKTSAGQYNLNSSNLATVQIPAVPLADQEEFAGKLAMMRAERDRVAVALEADNELFAALQHRAFRGEL